jgi:ADP-glucose pyrophosphorylase
MIHADAKVRNSVIGDGVRVTNGIAIKNSLILEGAVVSSMLDIDRAVIMPDVAIDCPSPVFAAAAG